MSINQTFLVPASLNEYVDACVLIDVTRPMLSGTEFKVNNIVRHGISHFLMCNPKVQAMSREPDIYEQMKTMIKRSVLRII